MSEPGSELTVAGYRQVEPILEGRFAGWSSATSKRTGKLVRLFALTPQRLSQEVAWKEHGPNPGWLERHAGVEAPHLFTIWEIVRASKQLVVVTDGEELRDYFEGGGMEDRSLTVVRRTMLELVGAVRALHKAGLVHGRLSGGWMMRRGDGGLCLLRDPLFEPRNPLTKRASCFAWSAEMVAREAFAAAPEFLSGQQLPTVRTDLYAVGCLWYRLLSGKWPFVAPKLKALMELHAQQEVQLDEKWGLTSLEAEAIRGLLAKRPEERPDSIDGLWSLLSAVGTVPAVGTVSVRSSASSVGAEEAVGSVGAIGAVGPVGVVGGKSQATREQVPLVAELDDAASNVLQSFKEKSSDRKQGKRRAKGAKWKWPLVGGGVALGVVGVAVWLGIMMLGGSEARTAKEDGKGSQAGAEVEAPNDAGKKVDPRETLFQVVAAEEQQLWLPPQVPEPCGMEMLPPGGQAYLFLNTSRLFSGGELGEWFGLMQEEMGPLWQWVERITGVAAIEAKEVVIAYSAGESGWPRWVIRMTTERGWSLEELKKKWPEVREEKEAGGNYWVGSEYAYYPKLDGDGLIRRWVVGDRVGVRDVVEMEGLAPPLVKQMEQAWKWTDARSEVNFLFHPGFFRTDAVSAVRGHVPAYGTELERWTGTPWQAGVWRLQSVDKAWYVEVRGVSASDAESMKGLGGWREMMDQLPDVAERRLQQSEVHPYWRPLALRMPSMLRSVVKYVRFGTEQGHGVVNVYLPAGALSNLGMLAWMGSRPWGAVGVVGTERMSSAGVASSPLTLEQILASPIQLRFEQQSFENAVRSVLEEIQNALPEGHPKVAIEIDGAAFSLEGITRNKEVRGFDFQNQPAREALNDLIRKSNPETSDSLDSPKQKVVWVDASTDVNHPKIRITTRRGLEGSEVELPLEFRLR